MAFFVPINQHNNCGSFGTLPQLCNYVPNTSTPTSDLHLLLHSQQGNNNSCSKTALDLKNDITVLIESVKSVFINQLELVKVNVNKEFHVINNLIIDLKSQLDLFTTSEINKKNCEFQPLPISETNNDIFNLTESHFNHVNNMTLTSGRSEQRGPYIPDFPPSLQQPEKLWPIARSTPSYEDTGEWQTARSTRRAPPPRQHVVQRPPLATQNRYQVLNSQFGFTITEIEGDIFAAPPTMSLAHCVGEDLLMTAGIAIKFREIFGNVSFLKSQHKRTGQVITLPVNELKYVFYLVTKAISQSKPNLRDVESSLVSLKTLCIDLGVKELAMPRISAGKDKLPWHLVKKSIENIFSNTNIKITVFYQRDPVQGNVMSQTRTSDVGVWPPLPTAGGVTPVGQRQRPRLPVAGATPRLPMESTTQPPQRGATPTRGTTPPRGTTPSPRETTPPPREATPSVLPSGVVPPPLGDPTSPQSQEVTSPYREATRPPQGASPHLAGDAQGSNLQADSQTGTQYHEASDDMVKLCTEGEFSPSYPSPGGSSPWLLPTGDIPQTFATPQGGPPLSPSPLGSSTQSEQSQSVRGGARKKVSFQDIMSKPISPPENGKPSSRRVECAKKVADYFKFSAPDTCSGSPSTNASMSLRSKSNFPREQKKKRLT